MRTCRFTVTIGSETPEEEEEEEGSRKVLPANKTDCRTITDKYNLNHHDTMFPSRDLAGVLS